MAAKKTGVLGTLAGATPNRRTIDIIVDAALADEHASLARQLDQALIDDRRDGSLGNPLPNFTRVTTEMDAKRDAIIASTVTFTLDPLDWRDRVRLQASHAPRENDPVDARYGYNIDTYPAALVRASTTSVTDAAGDTVTDIPDATWVHLLGDPEADPPVRPALNFGSVNRLIDEAQAANDRGAAVPPSARSSLVTQDSGASSTPPSPGASPRSGSAGGSRRTSPKSSTTTKATSTRARSAGS